MAVHCVTAAQLVVTIAALRAAGSHPLDRIEHAAVVPDDTLADLADLAVTVVTQPNFIAERGDQYLAEVPAAEHAQLWRAGSLLKANVQVALSTDMPFGRGDPWAAMRAAVRRGTPSGAVLNAGERISAEEALTMFLGWPDRPSRLRAVEPGQPGDLCVLTQPPAVVLAELDAGMVAAQSSAVRSPTRPGSADAHPTVCSAERNTSHWVAKNRRDTSAFDTTRSKPWKAPGTTSTSHGTPAAFRRSA